MSEEISYFWESLRNLSRKHAIIGSGILLLVIIGLGYFRYYRPVIVMVPGHQDIKIKNEGGKDALIHKVDGFWYWAGQVALLANMPDVHQGVKSGADPVPLQVPDIPAPGARIVQRGPCYMKLEVRYRIPGIPIFRFTTPFYFKYDSHRQAWAAMKTIPPKYRSLGNLAVGNIGKIELSFD